MAKRHDGSVVSALPGAFKRDSAKEAEAGVLSLEIRSIKESNQLLPRTNYFSVLDQLGDLGSIVTQTRIGNPLPHLPAANPNAGLTQSIPAPNVPQLSHDARVHTPGTSVFSSSVDSPTRASGGARDQFSSAVLLRHKPGSALSPAEKEEVLKELDPSLSLLEDFRKGIILQKDWKKLHNRWKQRKLAQVRKGVLLKPQRPLTRVTVEPALFMSTVQRLTGQDRKRTFHPAMSQ